MFAGLEVKRPREKTPANLHADFAASSPPLQALHATTFSSPSTLEGIHSRASVHHIAGQVSLGPHRDSPHSTPHTPHPHALGSSPEAGAHRLSGLAQGHPMASWAAKAGPKPGSRLRPPSGPQATGTGGWGAGLQPGPLPGTEKPFFTVQQSLLFALCQAAAFLKAC